MRSQRFGCLVLLICGLFNLAALGQPVDSGWPRTHQKDGQTVVIYQPQVDEWPNQTTIAFRAATAVTARGATEPVYGVINAHADTLVDRASRNVYLTNIKADITFPGQNEQATKNLQAMVQDVMLSGGGLITVSLDRVLACMSAAAVKPATVQVSLAPPPIYWSDSPAILVIFQGPPLFKPITGTPLQFAVNTNWDVVLDPASSQYYLLNGDSWLMAPDPMKGPWTAAGTLPAGLSNLPAGANWDEVRKHIPGTPAASVPKVIASNVPAELIVTQGRPLGAAIAGTALEQVVNPEMPLFYDKTDASYYFLVAGRWFKSKELNGGWSEASTTLPADFAKIPADGKAGFVLASVPGTEEAKDAVLLASIPHKATVNINAATVTVAYDGAPKFEPITGTTMTYAVNTSNEVICENGVYHCCYQGIWFVSQTPTGPWAVSTALPPVLATIPPSSPVYNTTYVQIYGSTPTTVDEGYTSGYAGEYVATDGALVFGAGMLMGAALADQSYYYPYPAPYYSYGCGAMYSYGYGGYNTCGAAYYGPYGGAGYCASYNAATGTYSRSAAAYGAYGGSATVHQAYNPYTGTAASHSTASNGYESWGHSTAVAQNGAWASAGHQTNANGSSSGWAETSNGKSASGYQTANGTNVAKTSNGDVYAGKDGNVYQKTPDNGWQQHTSSGWQNVNHSETQNEMNSQAAARSQGNYQAERTNSFQGGGGFRGGGGRR